MSDPLEAVAGGIQLVVAAFVTIYLFQVFSVLPDDITTGPFSEFFTLLATLPWIFVIMAVLVFLTMVVEVFE